jgi:hypothetical protein
MTCAKKKKKALEQRRDDADSVHWHMTYRRAYENPQEGYMRVPEAANLKWSLERFNLRYVSSPCVDREKREPR